MSAQQLAAVNSAWGGEVFSADELRDLTGLPPLPDAPEFKPGSGAPPGPGMMSTDNDSDKESTDKDSDGPE